MLYVVQSDNHALSRVSEHQRGCKETVTLR